MLRSLADIPNRARRSGVVCRHEYVINKSPRGEWSYPWKKMQPGDCFRVMIGYYPGLGHITIGSAQSMQRRAAKKYNKHFVLCRVESNVYCFCTESHGRSRDAYWLDRVLGLYGIIDGRRHYNWEMPIGHSFDFPLGMKRHTMRNAIKRAQRRTGFQYELIGNRCTRIEQED